MTDETNTDYKLSRRKILGAAGTVGAAGALGGAATTGLLWDEEKFGNITNPNVLQGGDLDLGVGWEVRYYNWLDDDGDGDVDEPDDTLLTQQEMVKEEAGPSGPNDQPGPLVDLTDIKPGDVVEHTLSLHLFGNPGFLTMDGAITADSDNGITEPEDKVNGHTPDDSDGDPFAGAGFGLGAAALLAGAVPGTLLGDDEDGDDDGLSRKNLLRGAGAATGAAGLAGASGTAAADSDKGDGEPTNPDGPNDVQISNGTLDVTVGELGSGTNVQGSDWIYDGSGFNNVGTLYRETYGFRDGTGPHVDAEGNGSLVDAYPSSVSAGTTAESTVEIPVQTAGGTEVDLEVDRNVTLDPNEEILRVDYEVTNPSGSGATFVDLRLSQYVDYDIGRIRDDIGEYFLDSETGCEFIFQENSAGLFAGFTAEETSVNHDLRVWPDGEDNFQSSSTTFNNDDKFPDSGTADVTLAFEWSLGELAPGESTTFRNSFVYNPNQEEFEEELCEESPGEPDEGDGELDNLMECVVWHDGDDDGDDDSTDPGNNFPEEITDREPPETQAEREAFIMELTEGEVSFDTESDAFLFRGTLRELFDAMNDGDVVLDPGDDTPEAFPDSQCFRPSTTHYLGILCWLPRDIPGVNDNLVQTDRVEYEFGFNAIQCRHNVANDGSPMAGTIGEADADAESGEVVEDGDEGG